MNNFEDGIEILHIDEKQEKLTINIGKINEFHRAYTQLKKQKEEFKKWLNEELFSYKTGWFTQDMETTYKVGEHIKTLETVKNKIDELEGLYDGDIYRDNP